MLMDVSGAAHAGQPNKPAEQQNYRQMCMDRRVQKCLLFIV